ncbi:ATP-binding protein [Methanoculleus chikugoensis]|uniref:ATP-binding protein n=1 Tax=Methanoculleus chikugoensis TaxID=118126 RepID=UPI001FB3DEC2|nr:ATP-binding protein [Methanoculleus chikugoensis]
MPDERKPYLFTRFSGGDGEKSGRGLGLYICRMLIERYGGKIWADDRVEGRPEEGAASGSPSGRLPDPTRRSPAPARPGRRGAGP